MQHQQTRGDVEHTCKTHTKIASDDLIPTQSHVIHCAIMHLVLYHITTRQDPLTNMPYSKFINDSLILHKVNAQLTNPT